MSKPSKRKLPAGITQLPSGRYRWRTMKEGKPYNGTADTITEAKQAKSAAETDFSRGLAVDPTRLTFGEQLAVWLADKERSRAAKTVSGYRYTIDHYLTPELKALRLQSVRPSDLRAFYSGLEGKFKPNTLRQVRAVIHGCLHQATVLELIGRNPASVARPQLERSKDHADEEERFEAFNPEQAAAFLSTCQQDRWGLPFEFMLATGTRRGEACGLMWAAVDLVDRTIRIERSVTPVDGKPIITAPKTKGSRRTLYISQECAALLKRVKAQQALEQEIHPARWVDSGFVFTGVYGAMLHPDNLNRHMTALCAKAGIERLNIHGLRHTYASLALRARVPIDVVSKQLGHSSVTMTLDIYRTVYRQELQEYALDLSQLLRGDGSKNRFDTFLTQTPKIEARAE